MIYDSRARAGSIVEYDNTNKSAPTFTHVSNSMHLSNVTAFKAATVSSTDLLIASREYPYEVSIFDITGAK